MKILLVLPDNLKSVCVNSTLSIRVDFPHLCAKFTQLKFVWIWWKFHHFSTVIFCVTQIERISFILYKTFFRKGEERYSKNVEWTRTCFLLASKFINLISLLKRRFMFIKYKNCSKINLCIRYFVKIWYFVIANLVRTNKIKSRFAEILPWP